MLQKYLTAAPLYELARFIKPDPRLDGVHFVGIPRKHPYDAKKVLIVPAPYNHASGLLEFRLEDIAAVDERENLVSELGESVPIVGIWVRPGSTAVRITSFVVSETAGISAQ